MRPTQKLNLFTLVMINITAVLSLSSIAYMATIGLQSIIFFALAALLFFIPSALISAELASMMAENNGGVYTWVSRAFGNNTGLIAIWMEWFNNVISFPVTIAAMISTFAYIGFPNLAQDSRIMFGLMVAIMWSISLFNCISIGKTTILNVVGALFGMLLPGLLLILCAIYWFGVGKVQLHFTSSHDWIPSFSFATFALLVTVMKSYSGIQAVAFHSRNIKYPAFNVPVSMLLTVGVIFILTTLATISLAAIMPQSELNAMNGLIQGITFVLTQVHLEAIAPLITLCICLGMLSALSTWVLGPARAMQEVAINGLIPRLFAKTNRVGMPVAVLIAQAIIASILATLFLILPTIQAAFAMILALTSQFTVMMFILIFAAAIRLRFTESAAVRPFRVGKNGGNLALVFWAGLGIVACACAFFLGLFPPQFSHVQKISQYVTLMVIADLIIIAIPFLYIIFKQRRSYLADLSA